MVLERADDLKAIMNDNGTFIMFPPLGSSTSLITVFGDHKVNVQRTIRSVMQLVSFILLYIICLSLTPVQACQFYVASFWLLPAQFNPLLPPPTLSPTQVTAILKQVSSTTGAEVVFKSMNFEMYGMEHEVRNAINLLLEIDALKVSRSSLRTLSVTYRDTGLPPRAPLPDRISQRASRVHLGQKEWQDQ